MFAVTLSVIVTAGPAAGVATTGHWLVSVPLPATTPPAPGVPTPAPSTASMSQKNSKSELAGTVYGPGGGEIVRDDIAAAERIGRYERVGASEAGRASNVSRARAKETRLV